MHAVCALLEIWCSLVNLHLPRHLLPIMPVKH